MRQNGPKTAGKRAQNGGRGSEWAAALLKTCLEGQLCRAQPLGWPQSWCFGPFWGEFLSIFFRRILGAISQRPRNGHVTGTLKRVKGARGANSTYLPTLRLGNGV